MPDIFTHILNGIESLKGISEPEKDAILGLKEIFYLGCMGPDMFMYHDFYPWLKNRSASELGRRMHKENCGYLISDALKYLKENITGEVFLDDGIIYILGYICHYAADRAAHPFIYSRCGKYEKLRPETHKCRIYHKITEMAIDYHMAKWVNNEDINCIRNYKYIDIGKRIPDSIVNMYNFLFNIYFKELRDKLNIGFINESYICLKKAWKFFYDPYYIKRRLLKITGLDMFLYPVEPDKRDYMNEKKEEWPNPWNAEVSDKSFYQIFDESVRLSSDLLQTAIDFIKDLVSFEYMKDTIGNYSFASNTDVTKEIKEMKYFKIIF